MENTDKNSSWKGLTLEELRMQRAKALVKCEIGKVQLQNSLATVQSRAKENGVRGLLFKNVSIRSLKTTDYLFLGYKLTRICYKLWKKRH